MSAHAEFSIKLEPGVAIPLTAPQSQIYDVGGGGSLKALFGLTSFLDIGPSASVLLLPSSAEQAGAGVAWGFGAGLRLKRPHALGISPWLDADALYVRTDSLNRPGFDAAVGLAVPIGESRHFWIGPFVRYFHIFQSERAGFDNGDAKTLIAGVSFEVSSGVERKPEPPAQPAVAPPVEPPTVEPHPVEPSPDRDQDGVPDDVDRCPDASGPKDNDGCPKAVVEPAKVELKQKIHFTSSKAKLDEASLPALDEVLQALKDNEGLRVQIEGHADSSGVEDHNQTLSAKRAEVVLDYLVAHGIAKDRLVSKGLGSSVPIESNTTVAGREKNRRVEFIILKDRSAER